MNTDAVNVLLDEDIKKPEQTVALINGLRPNWHVQHAARVGLEGLKDPVIFAQAQNRSALLITADKDFSDIRKYPPGSHHGILLLRPSQDLVSGQHTALKNALSQCTDQQLQKCLTISDETTVRQVQRHDQGFDIKPLLDQAKDGHVQLPREELQKLSAQDMKKLLDSPELKTVNGIEREALKTIHQETSLLAGVDSAAKAVQERFEEAHGQEKRFGQSVEPLREQSQEQEKNQERDLHHER